ncbi:hypothetical protein ACFLZS_01125 [Patescibacteria group bacterium]
MKTISLIALGLAFAVAAIVVGTTVYAQAPDENVTTEDRCEKQGKFKLSKEKMQERREHRGVDLAEFLGIETEELKTKMEEFKESDVDKQEALESLLKEYDKTLDQFKEFKLEKMKERIAEKVAAGDLTQEKADQILEKMEEKMENFPGDGPHKGMGMRKGRH